MPIEVNRTRKSDKSSANLSYRAKCDKCGWTGPTHKVFYYKGEEGKVSHTAPQRSKAQDDLNNHMAEKHGSGTSKAYMVQLTSPANEKVFIRVLAPDETTAKNKARANINRELKDPTKWKVGKATVRK